MDEKVIKKQSKSKAENKEKQIEYIGKIALDLSKYPGEDFYCDGEVEDELLSIVRDLSPTEYGRVMEERKSWPILYHLSPLRENIVDWIPMKKTDKVLEVGSGCGAITGAFARKAGEVTCVDLSKKRSTINAYRHSECENVTIHVGNFKDIEPELPNDYDYICLIGVFEYGKSYIGGDTPYEDFLKKLSPHLKEGGRIVIAIENKYGLKYFAGCKEDHLGSYFSGIENYAAGGGVRTFGRRGLERIFRNCGVEQYHFYYPYPDYKFMTALYSDKYQPARGELSNNLRNFDRDRMLLFDEKSAFDGVIEEQLFSVFSNSYLVVLGEEFEVKYAKYSNDRAAEYRIRTEIGQSGIGKAWVRKYPMGEAAKEHIRDMATAYEGLQRRYQGSGLYINNCNVVEDAEQIYAEFEFVKGRPLSECMDECLERENLEGFYAYFKEYIEKIGYHSDDPIADFDPIFANILIAEDGWTLIDYEWTFGKKIDTRELAFRAIYCYLLEDEKRNKINLDSILDLLEITQEEAERYRMQEVEFQKFVTGDRMAMAEMRDLIGYRMMIPQKWIDKYQDSELVNRVQIYEDTGHGYSEEESYFVKEAYQGENEIVLELEVSGNVRMLRIDPAMDSCMVKIREMTFNGVRVPLEKRKLLITNGKIAKPVEKGVYQPSIVFATADPNLNIDLNQLERQAENMLCARMEIVRIPQGMARDMEASVKHLL